MSGGGIFTIQPFKALYLAFIISYELSRFPLWVLAYCLPALRPNSNWSIAQAIRIRIVRLFLYHYSVIRFKKPLSLEPGKEGDRFTIVQPQGVYQGPLDDKTIKPEKVGVTWTPNALQRSQVRNGVEVVLYFHGGAYIMGEGRDEDAGFAAKTMKAHSRVTHVICPQYRLACHPGGRFPAQLQDAVTVYTYLIEKLRVPPSNVIVAGDSAGGNLALALLRYIDDYGKNIGLPAPGAAWLWSPWIDVAPSMDAAAVSTSPNYTTDYINGAFSVWGSQSFIGGIHDPRNPYLSANGTNFKSKTSIWIQTGTDEVLYDSNVEFAKELKETGHNVKLLVVPNAPHDIILTGKIIGFVKEAQNAAKDAGEFLRANRLT